jgi:aspartate aminotransferase
MVQRLQAIEGVVCPEPLGAFYTFPKLSAYYGRSLNGPPIETSLDFCSALLQEAKLAVIPGGAFGADEHVRLSYAVSMEDIEEALNRLEWFLGKLE